MICCVGHAFDRCFSFYHPLTQLFMGSAPVLVCAGVVHYVLTGLVQVLLSIGSSEL